jgi:tricorn protease
MSRIALCLILVISLGFNLFQPQPATAVMGAGPAPAFNEQGYYQQPTIHDDRVIFCCEDDLWTVSASGGTARRLTASKGRCYLPRFSPDGKQVAFACTEDGNPEVYVMSSEGGSARRLTSLGGSRLDVCGWTPDGKSVLFVSNAEASVRGASYAYTVDAEGGEARKLKLGELATISMSPQGAVAIGRNYTDPARWKRYRGGTAGELWIGKSESGDFKPLIHLNGNLVWPLLVHDRVFFLSDHEGIGNIYSCDRDGGHLNRVTHLTDFYCRYPSTDGQRIVFTAGARIHVVDTDHGSEHAIDVLVPSNPTQLKRKFVEARDYLEEFTLHPKGHSIFIVARGQPFTMPLWEGAVLNHGQGSKVRYQHPSWFDDGERFALVSDKPGYEQIEVRKLDESEDPTVLTNKDLGHIIDLKVAPGGSTIAFSNHSHDVYLLDVATKQLRKIDHSPCEEVTDLSWSADGRWLAYSSAPHENMRIIRIAKRENAEVHDVTTPVRWDWSPVFDPQGKYLYFLSTRDYNPVSDDTQFDLSFPMATRPFLVTLRKDVPSPLVPQIRPFVKPKDEDKDKGANANKKTQPVEIDFDGINQRILGLPIMPGIYDHIAAVKDKVLYVRSPIKPRHPGPSWFEDESEPGTLFVFDFDDQKERTLEKEVENISLAGDHQTLVYRIKKRLRVIDATRKPDDEPKKPKDDVGRDTGWLDLHRITVMVQPTDEWLQMLREAWRLQRQHFWDQLMSHVDWDLVRQRYETLLPRVRTRSELSDLIWEMQGELGTSHAYEFLGDYRQPDSYQRGFLGADLTYDSARKGYRITRILRGDSWDPDVDSPLTEPGLNIHEGDVIVAVSGQPVSDSLSVGDLLADRSGQRVSLTILPSGKPDQKTRQVAVRTLKSESRLRYRAWVEKNRRLVHELSHGQLGYIHIPDMQAVGFSEFHRGFLAEYDYPGLVVDVRYNGGGNVSQLLLQKLLRKRIGYGVPRWGRPEPYPQESVAGPIIAVINQFAGSDGDIFSHAFKQYKLGPTVGKRTWGGVIGINSHYHLVDGTLTTQPEWAFWFSDVGWQVENHGVDPDYMVEITPQDYRVDKDPQLDKAVELGLAALKSHPVVMPQFDNRPSKPLPSALP